jgi:hypothetical protein
VKSPDAFDREPVAVSDVTPRQSHSTMRLYNTLTRTEEDFEPSRDNVVRMYTCGLTVYGRSSAPTSCGARCGTCTATPRAT